MVQTRSAGNPNRGNGAAHGQNRNTEEWTLGKGRTSRGVTDIINSEVIDEAVKQRAQIDKFLNNPEVKRFMEQHPELKFDNLLNSTSFKAGDGKVYNIKAILDGTQPARSQNLTSRQRVEAVADAAAILQTQIIKFERARRNLTPVSFSSDPKLLRGTRANHWNGQLEKFLKSPQAAEMGFVNVEGECRGQTTQQLRDNPPGLPAPLVTSTPYASRTPIKTTTGGFESSSPVTSTTTTGPAAPGQEVGNPKMPVVKSPKGRMSIPIPIPGLDSLGGACLNGCNGLIRVIRAAGSGSGN